MQNYEVRIKEVIQSVKKLTSGQKLGWIHLFKYDRRVRNRELDNYIVSNNRYIYSSGNYPIIIEGSSYCTTIDLGTIYLFEFEHKDTKDSFYIFALQGSLDEPIMPLNSEFELQAEVSELKSMIMKSLEDNTLSSFMNKIVSLSNDNKA